MYYDYQKVIDIAFDEIGYLEKATNENLDDKTANAGDKNYTKYARDLWAVKFFNSSKVGVAWCAVFVGWCFYKAFDKTTALKLLCQPSSNNCGAGCGSARNYFKSKNQLITENPKPGDVIYFYSSDKTEVSHTGIVYSTDKTYVYTVEGNTSSESGVVANGGAVAKKRYKLSYERIAGYGRPDWGVPDTSATEETAESGSFENETVSEIETSKTDKAEAAEQVTELANGLGGRVLENGSKGDDVKTLQELLNTLGFAKPELDVDGKYGYVTAKAVRVFQKAKGILVDGKYGTESHKAMVAAVAEQNANKDASAEDSAEEMRVATVCVQYGTTVNFRTAPDITAKLVSGMPRIKADEQVYVKTTGEGWAAIEYQGHRGYMMSEFLMFEDEEESPEICDDGKYYTVQKGDTLWGVSAKYLGGGKYYKKIMEANDLKNTVLKPGMVLRIPE